MNLVIALLQKEGRFAFLQKADGSWIFPGGPIRPGETVAQATLREIWQATSLSADVVGLLGTRDMGEDVYIYAYCAYQSGDMIVVDGGTFRAVEWKTPQEIINIVGNSLYEPVRAILEAARGVKWQEEHKDGDDHTRIHEAGART